MNVSSSLGVRMVGRAVSHYRIVEQLGAGGMGVVYRAEDTRLGRSVALKFLPEPLAHEPLALERFRREARAASALNHPHICTIHDIDEADGQTFIAMELLDGESLRARVARGRVPVATIVDTAIELADALEAAHAKGIVHRDLKPENIFITTRGTAKLLDFGIAMLAANQVAATAAVTTLPVGTGPLTLGTAAYMSPEQVRGEPLDGRTDLFSLGVVLYELTTGVQPFRGATMGAVIGEILTKAPTAAVRLNAEVPPQLERVVNKLLEKDRELRYQSARDVRIELERLRRSLSTPGATAAAAATEQASIVVLPFENLSPDPDNAFFADGLTDEIIIDLSKVRTLRVISRNSAMQLKKTTKDTKTLGRELNVRYVLEGSVRKMGNSLRITAQLADAATDSHLWAEKYSGTVDDVFELQEQLSRSIVDILKVTLTSEEVRGIESRAIPNVQAYECYLRAWQDIGSFSKAGLDRALALVNHALKIGGENPLLYATAALIQWQYHNAGIAVSEEVLEQAEALAARALRLDPQLPAAFFANGSIAWTRGELATAARDYRRVVELEPNGHALAMLSFIHSMVDQLAVARAYARRGLVLDPLNAWVHLMNAFADLAGGDAAAAADGLAKGLEVVPGDPMLSLFCAIARAYTGDHGQALANFDAITRSDVPSARLVASLFTAAIHGDARDVRAVTASPDAVAYANRDREISWWFADAFAAVGDKIEAIRWLGNSIDHGFFNPTFFSQFDPFLAQLRADASFMTLMDRARAKQRAFEEDSKDLRGGPAESPCRS